MIFSILVLLTAISLSLVSAYYSIVGLIAIFSAAYWPIIIMGTILELSKIMSTLWLHQNWERAEWKIKTYLVAAVCTLLLITSMGTFGFLSKAHLSQTVPAGDIQAQVSLFDEKIKTQRDNIDTARKALVQMDGAVDQVLARTTDENGATKAANLRRSQRKERDRLHQDIDSGQKQISQLQEIRAPIASQYRKVESDVGPIKYIAALLYGNNPDQNTLESAVRLVIIIIVLVFDPLAIVLLLASTTSLDWAREERKKKQKVEPISATATNEEYTQQLVEKDDALTTAREEIKFNKVKLAEYTKRITLLDENLRLTKEQLAQKENEQVAAEEEISELSSLLNNKTNHINELAPSMSNLEEECATLLKHEIQLQTELQTILNEYDVLFLEKTRLEKIVQETEEKIAALKEELEKKNEVKNPPEIENILIVEEPVVEMKDPATEVEEIIPIMPLPIKSEIKTPKLVADPDIFPMGGNANFGIAFPTTPLNGDLFLRVDYMPSKLFKWTGNKWIEIDKTVVDSLSYNEEYIKLLVEKISTGEYSIDDLSDLEKDQIAQYLKKNQST